MLRLFLVFSLWVWSSYCFSQEVTVAVAANFLSTLEALKPDFEKRKNIRLNVVSGSTGKHYALIKRGAPYDVFLAARVKEVQLLDEESLLEPNSRFTYAFGRLVMWSANLSELSKIGMQAVQNNSKLTVAIANPQTAPYGAAAIEAMEKSGVISPYKFRLVRAEDVGQAFLFTATQNADVAFIAQAQVLDSNNRKPGFQWLVPRNLYTPIEQQGGILKTSKHKESAKAFVEYLQLPEVKSKLESLGYDTDEKK